MDFRLQIKQFLDSGTKRKIFFASCCLMVGVGIAFFIKMVDNFIEIEGWALWDMPIAKAMMQIRNPWLNKIMLAVTLMGNWQMVLLGTILVGILLVVNQKWHYFWGLVATNTAAAILVDWAKTLTERSRPPVEGAIISQGGYSFPSGHSYFAGVFYGLLIYFWVRHIKRWRWRVAGALIGGLWIILLCFSRIYLGVHWFTDVVAGLAIGSAWLAATVLIMEMENLFHRKEKRPVSKRMAKMVGIFLTIWLMAWGWYYISFGTKMMRPTNKAAAAATRTAPAARSRA